ncbi:hypothetical protein FK519_29275, partial [Klebsiella pneumoniae]|nr:hypothetical protein [Klebsiella pneumoniae]
TLVIDLKDCFSSIPLHPDDAPGFAMSIPTTNNAAPAKRYHWVVLPQGMTNSPTLCQLCIAAILEPLRQKHPEWAVYHYMDDILTAADPWPSTLRAEVVGTLESA